MMVDAIDVIVTILTIGLRDISPRHEIVAKGNLRFSSHRFGRHGPKCVWGLLMCAGIGLLFLDRIFYANAVLVSVGAN